jgi:hypothetical protein
MTTTEAKELFKSSNEIIYMEYENFEGFIETNDAKLEKKLKKELESGSIRIVDGRYYSMDLYSVNLIQVNAKTLVELVDAYEEEYYEQREDDPIDFCFHEYLNEYSDYPIDEWACSDEIALESNQMIETMDPHEIKSDIINGTKISDIKAQISIDILDSCGGDSEGFFVVDGYSVDCMLSTPEKS